MAVGLSKPETYTLKRSVRIMTLKMTHTHYRVQTVIVLLP